VHGGRGLGRAALEVAEGDDLERVPLAAVAAGKVAVVAGPLVQEAPYGVDLLEAEESATVRGY
jgi:hypothetical protein